MAKKSAVGIDVQGYKITKLSKEGSISTYKGRSKATKKSCILKVLNFTDHDSADIFQLRSEYAKIQKMKSKNILKPIEILESPGRMVLVFEDYPDTTLKEFIGKKGVGVKSFLKIALQLAEVLEEVHENGLTHENVSSENIFINKRSSSIKLGDFWSMSSFAKKGESIYDDFMLKKRLPYISPEQTGRMNRSVDYRSDLYSFGIVLYEMITGRLPFDYDDPVEFVHAHIAKKPQEPAEVDRKISKCLSGMIMKLISKNAEDRYQNVTGLKSDISKYIRMLDSGKKIKSFKLAENDVSMVLSIPEKLYGREREIETLFNSFERSSSGHPEMALVSGLPGIGKTVLVNEIHRPIVTQKGYFITGKYDQLKKNLPYSGIIKAFQALVRQILTEDEKSIQLWRKKIMKAVGINGRVIIDVIPDVELIIGKQPKVITLGPKEARNRFELVFQRFVRVFADKEHPLAIFLDDLQWIDLVSLELINTLITDHESKYLMVIGAYRDNEVDSSHPLVSTTKNIEDEGIKVDKITLSNLKKESVNDMISDSFKTQKSRTEELGDIVYQKTRGNPFFVKQFLKTLYDYNNVYFDKKYGWKWDIKKIKKMKVTSNVVVLMTGKIGELHPKVQETLKMASCVGNVFSTQLLVEVCKKPAKEVVSDLSEAVKAGLIIRSAKNYEFVHDRIQEAAYSLIKEGDRKRLHYQIGRIMLSRTNDKDLPEKVFFILDQLNYGVELIKNQSDAKEFAELNLMAGKRAKASTAYPSALKYLKVGIMMMGKDGWERDHKLMMSLHMETAECTYLSGNFDEAEKLYNLCMKKSKTLVEKGEIYRIKMVLAINRGRPDEAVNLGIEGVKLFGIKIPHRPNKLSILKELIGIKLKMRKISIKDMMNLPKTTDDVIHAMFQVMMELTASAYFVDSKLYAKSQMKLINLCLKYGNSMISPISYISFGVLLGSVLGDYKSGHEIGTRGLKIIEKYDALSSMCRCYFVYGNLINHWTEHTKTDIDLLLEGHRAGLEYGDFSFAGYCLINILTIMLFKGDPVEKILKKCDEFHGFVKKIKYKEIMDIFVVTRQAARALAGKTKSLSDLSDDTYDENEHYRKMKHERVEKTPIHWYYSYKIPLLYLAGKYRSALKMIEESDEKTYDVLIGHINTAEYNFYNSLVMAAVCDTAKEGEKKRLIKRIKKSQKKLKKWADNSPSNFLHEYLFVEAELARITGRDEEAIELYDKTMELANKNEYVQHHALANEMIAKFWKGKGKDDFANLHIKKAYESYKDWGANSKLEALEKEYPETLSKKPEETYEEKGLDTYDLSSIMKSYRAISGEVFTPELLSTLTNILIESAGAQKGFIIMKEGEKLYVEAEGSVENPKSEINHRPIEEYERKLSSGIVNFVQRTLNNVVLNNASEKGEFVSDPYVIKYRPKSILCMPILKQKNLVAIIYLENNITENAFTPKRTEILKSISSQVAISIENARLYDNLEQRVRDRTAKLGLYSKRLEHSNALKDLFIDIIRHDILNPIGTIKGFAGILVTKKKTKDHKIYNMILKGAENLEGIVKSASSYARVEEAKEIEKSDMNLKSVISDLCNEMKPMFKKKGVKLENNVKESMKIKANAMIRDVFFNFLTNALKYAPEGKLVVIDAKTTGKKYKIMIKDFGEGIPDKYKKKIFTRLMRREKEGVEGTGLGLAIVKKTVELHNGKVWVTDNPKGGSVFVVELPVK